MTLREDELDRIALHVERNLKRYLDAKGRLVTAKIMAFEHLSNMNGSAARAYVEDSLNVMARDPEYGGSEQKPLSFLELSVATEAFYRDYEKDKSVKGLENGSQDKE